MNEPKPFEIGSEEEFEQLYPGYFERVTKALAPIDPNVVPDDLKRLIPYAEKWGIPDDIVRRRHCSKASPEEAAAFKAALQDTHSLFEEWHYTIPEEPDDEVTEKKVQYAQWRFSSMYVAELEAFNGRGLRGFVEWFKEYDPEGYEQWSNG